MDKAEQTMLDNLFKNTGKTLEQWIEIVKKQNFEKHGEILKFLKEATFFYSRICKYGCNEIKGCRCWFSRE